ncbi:hypothetical protein PENTCL1PPCAC_25825, partial [Pristionchus entomophagus]
CTEGFMCIEYTEDLAAGNAHAHLKPNDDCGNYGIVRFKLAENEFRIEETITNKLEDRANAMFVFRKQPKRLRRPSEMRRASELLGLAVPGSRRASDAFPGVASAYDWLVAVTIDGFLLYRNLISLGTSQLLSLKLPANVRNVPIRPMHSTSALTFASNDTIFVAGTRRHLYLWNIASEQLLRAVDAHFGRILNLLSISNPHQNLLISSSIDHSIKIWNMENIFEKSYSISTMDQPIERILIAKNNPSLAVVQTRKYLGIWDIRSHRFITTLVANVHGAVVTDCLLAADGKTIIAVESETLLVWELRTQSVVHSLPAVSVHQIVFLYREHFLGVVYKQLDTPEHKVARFAVYSLPNFEPHFSYEYPCRMFREATVMKDGRTVCLVVLFKGHDSLQTIDVVEKLFKHKFRPRQVKKQKDVIVHRVLGSSTNSNHIIVMDGDARGCVWDMKNRKLLRVLPNFNGVVSSDGKLGLYAPTKGGLYIIDMKSGNTLRTLIGAVAEGVNDVITAFTPNSLHVLYYHNGHKTLRCYRVSDGSLVGTFRPHAQLTCWTADASGSTIVIGGQDGSLLSTILYDDLIYEEVKLKLAQLPSRKHLADYLHVPYGTSQVDEIFDVRNLGAVTAAVTRFKSLIGGGANTK